MMASAARPVRSGGTAEDEAGPLAQHQTQLRQLLSRITRLDKWTWFQEDPTLYPGYADIVKQPMCMDFMRKVGLLAISSCTHATAPTAFSQKVEMNSYRSFSDFQHDMRLVFSNARAFNDKGRQSSGGSCI
jgi:hypothetical protein